jgi:hypothetical protein
MDSSGSGERPLASSCEHGNEFSGSIKGGNDLTMRQNISVTLLHRVSLTCRTLYLKPTVSCSYQYAYLSAD